MASMSKRAQARTEKELQDLLRAPGNSTCADCGARNPSWASWNLGVFLCMRCASIHRKLGTHISKVKSLSMDTWSNDQVDNMKRNGNLSINQMYNPKNKRPDMPLDADEADGAMERFIRKKYQEKSLSDGRPEVPSRDELPPPPRSKSPETAPPPIVPSKRSKFFGFGLRASSSAYPLSKHDKKHRNQAKPDNNFRISSEDYTSATRTSGSRAEMSDYDLQLKLGQLRDMGFTDNERNTNALKRHNGDIERSIAMLVKLGPSGPPTARKTTPTPTVSTTSANMPQTSVSAPQSATTSNNPFEQSMQSSGFGLSYGNNAPPATSVSNNPWQTAVSGQPNHDTGLEQSFSNMQVSQPLFPHSTASYSGQPQYTSQIVAPPMPNIPQQYPMTGSPVPMNNPFMQAPMSTHSTGSNPYAAHMQNIPTFAPSTNPFLSLQNSPNIQQTSSPIQDTNPFGLPPLNTQPQLRSQPIAQQHQPNIFDAQLGYTQNMANLSPYGDLQHGGQQQQQQQQFMQFNGPQSPPTLPNFQYGQPQAQQYEQQQPQQLQQSPTLNSQGQFNPYFQQPQSQSPQQQQPSVPLPPSQPQQPQPLMPQQTGHMDKKSILALYNYPQLAPAKPLASIPEPSEDQSQSKSQPQPQPQQQYQQSQSHQQFTSPAPSGTVYGNGNSTNGINSGKRSATMPASSMHSAGGTGSRNPFMSSANSSGSSTPAIQAQQQFAPFGYTQGSRHASHDSVAVNNPSLQEGRHSPDAFANLSARYLR